MCGRPKIRISVAFICEIRKISTERLTSRCDNSCWFHGEWPARCGAASEASGAATFLGFRLRLRPKIRISVAFVCEIRRLRRAQAWLRRDPCPAWYNLGAPAAAPCAVVLDVGIIHQSLIACQDLGSAKGYPRRIRLGCPAGLARSSFPMSLAGVTLRVTDFHFDSKNASRGPYFPTDDTLFRILGPHVLVGLEPQVILDIVLIQNRI